MQALAQPLLTMTARATPRERRQVFLRHQHRRGLRAVGREDGRRRGRRVRDEQREVRVAVGLDAGADAGGAEPARRRDAARNGRDRAAHYESVAERRCRQTVAPLRVERRIERNDHRVLAALPEVRALHAVGEHLLGQPEMRHDREPHVDEVRGRVGERAQLLEALAPGAAPQFLDDPDADPMAARAAVHRERSHFGHVRAERRQLGAADDLSAPESPPRSGWRGR